MKNYKQNGQCHLCRETAIRGLLTEEEFSILECNKQEMYYAPGETIIRQGSFVSQVFFLKAGIVKYEVEAGNNRHSTVQIIENGNFIALPVIGKSDTYPYSVVALTRCTLCVIRAGTLRQLLLQNEKANKYLIDHFTETFHLLYHRYAITSTLNNYGKLLAALTFLSGAEFKEDILAVISRKELAQFASISIESLNKLLAEMQEKRLVSITKNKISLVNRGDLA